MFLPLGATSLEHLRRYTGRSAARPVYRRRCSRLVARNARNIPATDDSIHCATCIEITLTVANRELIEEASHQRLGRIQLTHGLLRLPVVRVLPNKTVCPDKP